MIHRIVLATGASVLALVGLRGVAAHAGDLISIDFEAGSVGASGSPVDGWEISTAGAGVAPEIASTGRSFLTGTPGNDEALFIRPYTPGAAGGFGDTNHQGVLLRLDTPITVPAGSNVYIAMEHFSDIALVSNDLKLSAHFGEEGSLPIPGFSGTTNDYWRTEVSYEFNQSANLDRAWRSRFRGVDVNGDPLDDTQQPSEMFHRGVHWDHTEVDQFGDPLNNLGGGEATNFLDRSYEATALFRPESGSTGVEGQVNDSFGETRTSDDTFDRDLTPPDPNTNTIEMVERTIDYVFLALARYDGFFDGPGGLPDDNFNFGTPPIGYAGNATFSNGDPVTNPTGYVLDNPTDLKIGVKSLRFGIADSGDFNLDGVVDGDDEALATANLGMTEGATFFDGDNDGDGDVDADDLSIFDSMLLGDADGDGDVDGDDLISVQTNFGSVMPPPGDADGDGDVDGDDLIAVQTNFGATSATAVPEPSAAVLVALVAAGVCGRRRVG